MENRYSKLLPLRDEDDNPIQVGVCEDGTLEITQMESDQNVNK